MSADHGRYFTLLFLVAFLQPLACVPHEESASVDALQTRQIWETRALSGLDAEILYRGADGARLPIQPDSLFMGYAFDMTRDRFFEYSWDLNRQGRIVNGGGAEIVADTLLNGIRARMSFYPEFVDDRMYEMPVTLSYSGWSPWNRSLWSDSLLHDLRDQLTEFDGIRFQETPDTSQTAMALYGGAVPALTGRRDDGVLIRIGVVDEKQVKIRYLARPVFDDEPKTADY